MMSSQWPPVPDWVLAEPANLALAGTLRDRPRLLRGLARARGNLGGCVTADSRRPLAGHLDLVVIWSVVMSARLGVSPNAPRITRAHDE